MAKIKWYEMTALIILVFAGINWGLTAFEFNIIEKLGNLLFSQAQFITRAYFITIVYLIFGLAGIYGIYILIKINQEKK